MGAPGSGGVMVAWVAAGPTKVRHSPPAINRWAAGRGARRQKLRVRTQKKHWSMGSPSCPAADAVSCSHTAGQAGREAGRSRYATCMACLLKRWLLNPRSKGGYYHAWHTAVGQEQPRPGPRNSPALPPAPTYHNHLHESQPFLPTATSPSEAQPPAQAQACPRQPSHTPHSPHWSAPAPARSCRHLPAAPTPTTNIPSPPRSPQWSAPAQAGPAGCPHCPCTNRSCPGRQVAGPAQHVTAWHSTACQGAGVAAPALGRVHWQGVPAYFAPHPPSQPTPTHLEEPGVLEDVIKPHPLLRVGVQHACGGQRGIW